MVPLCTFSGLQQCVCVHWLACQYLGSLYAICLDLISVLLSLLSSSDGKRFHLLSPGSTVSG